MTSQKGFSLPIILAIIAVVLVGGGAAAFLYITNNTNPALESSAYTPAQQPLNVLKPDSEVGFKAPEEKKTSRTVTTPTSIVSTATGGVDVSTSLSTDKKTFTINFKSSTNFAGITSITYNLTYTADSGPRGITGTITTDHSANLITKALTLGTCSATCTYDASPRLFRLSVSTTSI